MVKGLDMVENAAWTEPWEIAVEHTFVEIASDNMLDKAFVVPERVARSVVDTKVLEGVEALLAQPNKALP